MSNIVTIAGAHLEPVLLDKTATLKKAVAAIAEAADQGARLVAFPESFIPGFPIWAALRAPIGNHELFGRFVQNSLYFDGPEVEELRWAARRHEIVVSMGFSERNPASLGSIWNSNVLIGADGNVLSHHRKIVPTFYEKLIWTPGDGHGLRVVATPIGRLGVLICGENTNPLARYTLMAEAEQLHISTYPPLWPTRDPASGGRNYDLENAIRIRAGAHSFEAKVFNLVVSAVFAEDSAKALRSMGEQAERIVAGTARGISLVIDPFGDVVGDIQRTEGIFYRTIDTDDVLEPKQFHDISGSYNRFDIFDLHVDRRRVQPITIRPDPAPATFARLAPYPSTGSAEPGSPETSNQTT